MAHAAGGVLFVLGQCRTGVKETVKNTDNILFMLVAIFAPYSLLSIGGGSAIITGVQTQVVEVQHWATVAEFVEMFAATRAAPGPGTMLSPLVGWKVAGWSDALVATMALMVPSAILCFFVFRLSNQHREKKWNRALRKGLAPVGVGLTIAGCMTLFHLAGGGLIAASITALSTAILLWQPAISVVFVLAGGAFLSILFQLL